MPPAESDLDIERPLILEPDEEVEEIPISRVHPEQKVKIGTRLGPQQRSSLISFLEEHAEVFAWSAHDLVGVDPSIVTHHLSVNPAHPPIRQKRRTFAPERNEIINAEIDRLLEAHHIREVHYPEWLANTVVVPKKGGKWRVCVDYTDLNRACPKDSFPLPKIDQLVDSTAGNELLTFMGAYSGYNQIKMHPAD